MVWVDGVRRFYTGGVCGWADLCCGIGVELVLMCLLAALSVYVVCNAIDGDRRPYSSRDWF